VARGEVGAAAGIPERGAKVLLALAAVVAILAYIGLVSVCDKGEGTPAPCENGVPAAVAVQLTAAGLLVLLAGVAYAMSWFGNARWARRCAAACLPVLVVWLVAYARL
jgi:exosortase/archaeosortase